jgi:hypothetical protein
MQKAQSLDDAMVEVDELWPSRFRAPKIIAGSAPA